MGSTDQPPPARPGPDDTAPSAPDSRPAAPVDSARSRRTFLALYGLLTALYCLPVVLFRALPVQDAPDHFAIVSTLADQHDDPHWHDRFEDRLGLRPYSGYYAVAVAASRLVGVEVANRLMLVLFVVGFVASLLHLLTTIDPRLRWASLLGFLLVYGDSYLVGFFPFLWALPLVLEGLALAVGLVTGGDRPVLRSSALVVLSLATIWVHPLATATLLFAAAALVPALSRSWSATLRVAGLLAPSAIALLWFLAAGDTGGTRSTLPLGFELDYLLRTPWFLADAATTGGWLLAELALTLALVIPVAVAGWRAARERRWPDPRAMLRSPLVAAVCFAALFLVVPFRRGTVIWLDLRLAPLVWLMLLAAVGGRLVATRWGKSAAVALCLVNGAAVLDLHRSFQREAAPLFQVIAGMEPGKRLLAFADDLDSDVLRPLYRRQGVIAYYSPYAHLGGYYHAARGGVSPFMTFHASLDWIPLGLRDRFLHDRFGPADPFDDLRIVSLLPELSRRFDYILVRARDRHVLRLVARRATPITAAGEFHLFAGTPTGPPAADLPRP